MALEEGNEEGGAIWIFGYGSLIWRPGFEFQEKRLASVAGFERKFCQASHDHRGTPESPGRVVTLVPAHHVHTTGVAFRLASGKEDTLAELEIREQDGYSRKAVPLRFPEGGSATGLTWIAEEGNPSWRGGESLISVARTIASAEGPSGLNSDYLFQLQRALDKLSIRDIYIEELATAVRQLPHGT